jgi:hypothetical protein
LKDVVKRCESVLEVGVTAGSAYVLESAYCGL